MHEPEIIRTELITTRLSDVEPEPVEWLWPERFAIGKLSIIVGDPDVGKSFLTLDMAARVSTGTPWPDCLHVPNPPGDVILASGEDDLPDTIRPRLDAAHADCRRITALGDVSFTTCDEQGNTEPLLRTLDLSRDLPRIEEKIEQCADCRLVVIDPVSCFMGGTDSHKNAEVRALLGALASLAARKRVAIVCVSHFRKQDGPAKYRILGSLAFCAAARAVWYVTAQPDGTRLMLLVKNNLSELRDGLSYTLRCLDGNRIPTLDWDPTPVHMTADEACTAPERRTDRDNARDWLQAALAGGPRPVNELKAESQCAGIAWRTLKRALKELGIKPRKAGRGPWTWGLPDEECQPESVAPLAPFEECQRGTLQHAGPESEECQPNEAGELAPFDPAGPAIPDGWGPLAWAGELERKAGLCASTNPELAAQYRAQAASIRARMNGEPDDA